MNKNRKVLAVDFDGVIAKYYGFKGNNEYGEPIDIENMREELHKLKKENWHIIIWTSRTGLNLIENYLNIHKIPFDSLNYNMHASENIMYSKKIRADVYLDDRGMTFDGNWSGMADKVMQFKEHWRKEEKEKIKSYKGDEKLQHDINEIMTMKTKNTIRKTLPFKILGYRFDQISVLVHDAFFGIEKYKSIGYDNWRKDKILAIQSTKDAGSKKFLKIKIAFNYNIMPCEFQLISIHEGYLVHLPKNFQEIGFGLSHFGINVHDIDKVASDFESFGFPFIARIETVHHTNSSHCYNYYFMDTRELGFITKLIQRIEK